MAECSQRVLFFSLLFSSARTSSLHLTLTRGLPSLFRWTEERAQGIFLWLLASCPFRSSGNPASRTQVRVKLAHEFFLEMWVMAIADTAHTHPG